MSHFVVLVIGDNIEKQLQAYHEYECTGIEDEYVVDVDITDEVVTEFNKSQTVVKLRDGTVISRWSESLYTKVPDSVLAAEIALGALNEKRDQIVALTDRLDDTDDLESASQLITQIREACGPDEDFIHKLSEQIEDAEKTLRREKLFNNNKFELPDGAVEVELTADQARVHGIGYASMLECAEEYYGSATERDGRFYRRTNPNKKWDWWVIGGRWTGWFRMKPGCSGTLGKASWGSEPPESGTADQFRKGDVDFDAMRGLAGEKAGAVWDKAHAIIGNETWLTWEEVRIQHEKDGLGIDKAREFYYGQPAIRLLRESQEDEFKWEIDNNLMKSRDEFVQRARDSECIPYAMVHEGKWAAKGEMGWFGFSSNETNQTDWNAKVAHFIDQLPDDTMITVVDCHI